MVIRKRPVDQVQIKVLELQVEEGLLAGCDDILLRMLVVPKLGM
jgi:hypothetical protein